MPKYHVYGTITGQMYLGEFEAETAEKAIIKGLESGENHLDVPHGLRFELDNSYNCEDGFAELIEGNHE